MEFQSLHTQFVERLLEEYNLIVSKRRQYSLRAFARDLKIDPGTLSQILRLKRNPSDKFIINCAANLEVPLSSFIQDLHRRKSDDGIEARLLVLLLQIFEKDHSEAITNFSEEEVKQVRIIVKKLLCGVEAGFASVIDQENR